MVGRLSETHGRLPEKHTLCGVVAVLTGRRDHAFRPNLPLLRLPGNVDRRRRGLSRPSGHEWEGAPCCTRAHAHVLRSTSERGILTWKLSLQQTVAVETCRYMCREAEWFVTSPGGNAAEMHSQACVGALGNAAAVVDGADGEGNETLR